MSLSQPVYLVQYKIDNGYEILDCAFMNKEQALDNLWNELARIPSTIPGYDTEVHEDMKDELKDTLNIHYDEDDILLTKENEQLTGSKDMEILYGKIISMDLI